MVARDGPREVTIYALLEPTTKEVRYVGQTRHPWRRYAWHLAALRGNSPRVLWLKGLEKQNTLPGWRVLEHVTRGEAFAREQWWIRYW